jgi:hypothetical protein
MRTTPLKRVTMAETQLALLSDRDWQLDERTREIGRRGVAEAREALRRSRSRHPASADPARSRAA